MTVVQNLQEAEKMVTKDVMKFYDTQVNEYKKKAKALDQAIQRFSKDCEALRTRQIPHHYQVGTITQFRDGQSEYQD